MNDLMQDAAWEKTKKLVEEKYGKNLTYRAMKLVSAANENDEINLFYSHGADLIIPLKLKNSNLGDIIINEGSLLSHQQKSEITDLVKFLIEPKIYSMQLKQSEANLLTLHTPQLTLVDSKKVLNFYHSEKTSRQTLSQIVLLKSTTELARNRVALKIHEMTERNLFVHLNDIIESLTTKEDLKTLNDVTVYIPDVENLSKSTLGLLKDYLEMSHTDGPLFLVGSKLTMEAIEKTDWPLSLKKDLMGFYFDIDRVPLAQQTSADILELLFFELDPILS